MMDPGKLRLVQYPDPRLLRRCKPVARFDDALAAIAARMVALMHEHRGVGLAAPQVGLELRMFVCQPPDATEATAYINPVLTLGEEQAQAEEGCLSLPEVAVQVRRAVTCGIAAFDTAGKRIESSGTGLVARIWQHECDHLDGHLIIERMTESERIANRKLLRQMERDYKKH